MRGWRLAVAMVLLAGIGVPLAAPLLELSRLGDGWLAWAELGRMLALASVTLQLVTGTLALALPVGVAGAILLYRTDLPCRSFFRFLLVLTLFEPLPLLASAWQATLGGGWLASIFGSTATGTMTGKPWAEGLGAAMLIHAAAGIPWVVVLVGQGLCWVEVELEEEALTTASPWRVLWSVSLRRSWAMVAVAGIWVTLQTATEITITDMLQVRTFAEEVYFQFVLGDRAALARSVAISLPVLALTWLVVVEASRRLEKNLPSLRTVAGTPLLFPLGRARLPALGMVVAALMFLVGVPLAGLVWKAGLHGSPEVFSMEVAGERVVGILQRKWRLLAASLTCAALAGALTAGLALVCSWLALEARGFRAGVLCLLALAWAVPGPIVGLGLKQTIDWLMDGEDWLGQLFGEYAFHPLRNVLYLGPSLLPIGWALAIRFFPCALAVIWPIARLLPAELRAGARVDGAGPLQEFRHVVWPLLAAVWLRGALAVGILSLGEISASKLVATPGGHSFAVEVFIQMHYGVQNDLAALCLVLLLLVILGGGTLAVCGWLWSATFPSPPYSGERGRGEGASRPHGFRPPHPHPRRPWRSPEYGGEG